MTSLTVETIIVGAGVGGCAAALALARAGRRVILTEEFAWIGGQFTSQAVPPDENRWIEYEAGIPAATHSYLHLRDAVRQWYRDNRSLTDAARADLSLNPGHGWVSHLCAEPKIVHEVMMRDLGPHIVAGRVTLLLEHEPVAERALAGAGGTGDDEQDGFRGRARSGSHSPRSLSR